VVCQRHHAGESIVTIVGVRPPHVANVITLPCEI